MYFCPNCKFMVYTKVIDGKDDEKVLINYCKQCGWEGEQINTSTSVYKRNYQDDYIADRVISNKYTIFDSTLPRVKYDCINENCITKKSINDDIMILVNDISADLDNNEFIDIFKDRQELIENIDRVRLTSAIITLKSSNDKRNLTDFIMNKGLSVESATIPQKEVIYIKYDNINMKYLYICANCGTSWKKN